MARVVPSLTTLTMALLASRASLLTVVVSLQRDLVHHTDYLSVVIWRLVTIDTYMCDLCSQSWSAGTADELLLRVHDSSDMPTGR